MLEERGLPKALRARRSHYRGSFLQLVRPIGISIRIRAVSPSCLHNRVILEKIVKEM